MRGDGSYPNLGSRFRIVREIGTGGMGVVYEAEEAGRSGHVALKTLPAFDANGIYELKQEFRGLADLVHPNLVRLFELVEYLGTWFFTMELVQGVTFLEHMRSRKSIALQDTIVQSRADDVTVTEVRQPMTSARSTLGDVVLREAMRQLTEGLLAVHAADKLHCDLKPSNVLVATNGRVVILDFGLIIDLRTSDADERYRNTFAGTPIYMSPEQARGRGVTAASDWYAVGVMLYEALVGRPPFDGPAADVVFTKQTTAPPPPSVLVEDVPADLERLALDLLAIDPSARPVGREVLERLVDGSRSRLPKPSGPRAPISKPGVFVGRAPELAQLREAFRASEMAPVTMLVLGRSGFGKSTLVERFLAEVRGRDLTVLVGRCYERESVPYKAFDGLIDDLSRHLMRLPDVEAARLIPRDARALTQLFPVLRRIDALNDDQLRSRRADEHELRRRAFRALRELLARLADRTRLVLWIDDLQWGDIDSAHLISALCEPPDAPGVFLLGTCRSEERARSPMLSALGRIRGDAASPAWDFRELELSALDPNEAERAAAELLAEADASHAARVARESAGNPFFIAQLVEWIRDGGGADVTLSGVVRRRVAAMPKAARDLLAIVSVAGRPITPDLAFVAGGLNDDGDDALATLRAARLVRTAGTRASGSVEPYHDRIREMVVASLTATELEACHQQLAESLIASGSDDAAALALHLEGARRLAEASVWWERVGDAASAALAFEEAARAYRRAEDTARATSAVPPILLRKLGEALAAAARGREAVPVFERAAATSSGDDALEFRLKGAEQLLLCGSLGPGLERLGQVLHELGIPGLATPTGAILDYALTEARLKVRGMRYEVRPESDVPRRRLLTVDACRTAARVLSMTDPLRSGAFQSRQLLEALGAGERSRLAGAVSFSAIYAAAMNRTALSDELLRMVQALATDGDPAGEFHAALAHGASQYVRGHIAEAMKTLAELAEQRPPGSDLVWSVHFAQLTAIGGHLLVGSFRRVVELVHRIAADAKDRGDEYSYSNLMLHAAQWEAIGRDEPDQARQAALDAMKQAPREMGLVLEWGADQTLDLIDQYAGRSERIFRRTPRKWAWKGRAYRHYRLQRWWRAFLVGGIAATCMRDRALARQARRVAEQYADWLADDRDPWPRAMAAAVRAAIAFREHDTARAADLIDEAIRGFDALGLGMYAIASRRAKGLIIGGDTGRALIEAADAQLGAEGVANPARFVEAFVSGFAD